MVSHFVSVVEEGIRHDSGVGGKEPEIDGNVTSRHVGRAVGLIFLLIKDTSAVGDVENVVSVSESVERSVADSSVSKSSESWLLTVNLLTS